MSQLSDDGPAFVTRLLDVIENEIVPLTEVGVRHGNKIFGAAILDKSDGALVVAATNEETNCPLFHGEVAAILKFSALNPAVRSRDCIFVATHEPCSLCLSAIAWAGFDNFFYVFGYERTRDDFSIPHDLRMLKEIFGCDNGGYVKNNAYWEGRDVASLISRIESESSGTGVDADLKRRVEVLGRTYAALSETYVSRRSEDSDSGIPLA